jgi:hypothetical protein
MLPIAAKPKLPLRSGTLATRQTGTLSLLSMLHRRLPTPFWGWTYLSCRTLMSRPAAPTTRWWPCVPPPTTDVRSDASLMAKRTRAVCTAAVAGKVIPGTWQSGSRSAAPELLR